MSSQDSRSRSATAPLPIRAIALTVAGALGALTIAPNALGAGSEPAAVDAPAVAPASSPAPEPEPAYATKQRPLVTLAAGGPTKLRKKGDQLTVTLPGVRRAEVSTGSNVDQVNGLRAVRAAWNTLGTETRGAVTGSSKRGKQFRAWVTWGQMAIRNGNTVVTGTLEQGNVNWKVRAKADYPLWSADRAPVKQKKLAAAAITAGHETSEKWNFIGTGRIGILEKKSGDYRLTIQSPTESMPGVQPTGRAALMKLPAIDNTFDTMKKFGARPRLVVSGKGKGGPVRSLIFYAKSLNVKNGDLVIGAGNGSSVTKKTLKQLKKIKAPGFMLDVANPGNQKSFVLVTGDSIASGEGASMGGTYLNGNLALDEDPTIQQEAIDKSFRAEGIGSLTVRGTANITIPIPVTDKTQVERWKKFCTTVDLACTGVKVVDGELEYKRNPGKVYEEGTWEESVIEKYGFSCHRSKTAPGTWLARYYAQERGLEVDSINLACSGATTDRMLDKSYLGEEPQVEQVKDIAKWVQVDTIVNTIGANDIKFSKIAKDCIFAPITPLLSLFTGGAEGSLVDLLFPSNGDPTPLALLTDDIKPGPDGGIRSANTWFSPGYTPKGTDKVVKGELCSQEDAAETAELLAELPGRIAEVVEALHRAAPEAIVVQSNYPNEVPDSAHTYFPRQQWWDATRNIWLSGGDITIDVLKASMTGPTYSQLNGRTDRCAAGTENYQGMREYLLCAGTIAVKPAYPPCKNAAGDPLKCPTTDPAWKEYPPFADSSFSSFFDAAADEGNPAHSTGQLISKNMYSFGLLEVGIPVSKLKGCVAFGSSTCNPGGSSAIPVNNATAGKSYRFAGWWYKFLTQGGILDTLSLGAIMFGLDQDWAAKSVIPGLNSAVVEGVQKADPNGEYTIVVDQSQTFNGRELGSKFVGTQQNPIFKVWGYDPQGPGAYPEEEIAAKGPEASRAQYVNNFFAGQDLPIVCPGKEILKGEKGCIGSDQEAVHPNWRGQAAIGNCIVAVVTRGGGNACVRSIGNGKSDGENYTANSMLDRTQEGLGAILYSDVDGKDELCLAPLSSRNDLASGTYTPCTNGIEPDPKWSPTYKDGRVTWRGEKVWWG